MKQLELEKAKQESEKAQLMVESKQCSPPRKSKNNKLLRTLNKSIEP